MEVVYPCCCGLDVHKKSIPACVLWAEAKGKSRKEKKRFGTSLTIGFSWLIGSSSAA
jgi:transposase